MGQRKAAPRRRHWRPTTPDGAQPPSDEAREEQQEVATPFVTPGEDSRFPGAGFLLNDFAVLSAAESEASPAADAAEPAKANV